MMLGLAQEPEALALGLPIRRQGMDTHEGSRREFRRLTSLKDRFDDIRGEEGERQDAAHVTPIQGFVRGDGIQRARSRDAQAKI